MAFHTVNDLFRTMCKDLAYCRGMYVVRAVIWDHRPQAVREE